MLSLYLLGQSCLHITVKPYPYLSGEIYSRKYEKQPKIVIHAYRNITEKLNLLKMCGPKIRLCLSTFWPLASKLLIYNSTTIDTLSWLGGAEVTQPLNSIPGSGQGFYLFCFVLLLFYYFLSKIALFVTYFCNSFDTFYLHKYT